MGSASIHSEPETPSRGCKTMTFKQWRRQVEARLLPPLIWALIQLIWKTCRIELVLGKEHLSSLLDKDAAFIPCYWHQQQIFCIRCLLDLAAADERLKLGYLISPSADGDMATQMFGDQGVHIIRGSATRGGAQALREIYLRIKNEGISPIVTPDGPTGPIYQCKPGVAMLAQLSKAPLVPMAYAASSAWHLRSWDKFTLPRPFSRIVIAIGEPVSVTRELAVDNFEPACEQMNTALNGLSAVCSERLAKNRS